MGKHIHIVGCSPRSGTSLMQELMTTCFEIDDFCDHERSIFRASDFKGDVVCTKNPREIPYVSWLLRCNPELYVIYVLRDPRSVVCSKHKKDPDNYYSSLKVWQESEALRSALVGHSRFLTVKYEDLVSTPDCVQKEIEDYMPFLQRKCAFSDFHKFAQPSELTLRALNGLRPIDNKRVSGWQEHLPRLKAQLNRYGNISSELIQLGYEADRQWEQVLSGVDAAFEKSVLDETYRSVNSLKMKYRVFRKVFYYACELWFQRRAA